VVVWNKQEVPELSTHTVLVVHHTDCGAQAAVRHHDLLVERLRQLLGAYSLVTWLLQVHACRECSAAHRMPIVRSDYWNPLKMQLQGIHQLKHTILGDCCPHGWWLFPASACVVMLCCRLVLIYTASLKATTLESQPMGSAARLRPMLRILNISNKMADADSSTLLLLSDASCMVKSAPGTPSGVNIK